MPPTPEAPATSWPEALAAPLRAAVEARGWAGPTPIQAAALPVALAGRDVLGRARTGSGKTLAFGLPLLQRVAAAAVRPGGLVLAPTRELALQVAEALKPFGKALDVALVPIVGGTPYAAQRKALARQPGVVVGTPGRLRDLLERGDLALSGVHTVVLDEADEMLRMGFRDDLERLLGATGPARQVLMFSATMPEAAHELAAATLRDPAEVQVEHDALTVHHIEQCWMRVPTAHKLETLHHLLADGTEGTTLVFAATRVACVDLADALTARGLAVDRLHGGLDQGLRERVLKRVRSGQVGALIATDVASRGIDVAHIARVVNVDLPDTAERYVHRIGRTARAGRAGVAVSLVTPKQKRRLRELAAELGADIVQVEVPTRGGLLRRQRAELTEALVQGSAAPSPHALALVRDLAGSHGRSLEALAAAAVQAWAEQQGLDLDPRGDDVLPDWVRPVGPNAPEGPTEDLDAVQVSVFVGKQAMVGASALVEALGARGVPSTRIGRIRVGKRQSQVGLPRAVAEALLAGGDTLEVAGRTVGLAREG